MNDIDHLKVFILCIDDVAADVNHFYVKRIYLVSFSYIVIEDTMLHGCGCILTQIRLEIPLSFHCL
jgi:hypothetical protein